MDNQQSQKGGYRQRFEMKSGNLWTPGHQAIYMGSLLFLDSGNMVTGFHFPPKERVQKNISERNHSMHK